MPKDVRIIPAQGSIDFSLSQGFITSLIQLTDSGTLSIASTGPIQIGASNTVAIQIVSNNFVGINTAIPSQNLHVQGNLRLTGGLYDSTNSPGTANQLLISTGSGIAWTSVNVTGILTASGGIANRVSKFLDEDTLGNSNITDFGTQITLGSATSVSGILTSFGFFGPGTNLTNLNASNLASGTVPSAVVSGSYSGITSVGTLSQLNVTGVTTSNGFFGPGTNLTNLNASNLASGTVPSAVVSGTYSGITSVGTLTQLNVSGVTTSNGFFGPGTNLTNLNAFNLASGTVPSAVVSGTYSGITSVGNLTQLNVTGITTLQNLELNGWLLDANNSAGSVNQILSSTGSGIAWTSVNTTGIITASGGTPNRVTKFLDEDTIANSNITDTGTQITLGSATSISGIVTSFGYFGPGTNLTNLNASNLASGTVPSAVVSGAYSGITSVGNLTQLNVTGITSLQNLELNGWLLDANNSAGTINQILSSTGTGIAWTSLNTTGILTASGGIPNRVSKFLDEDTLGNSNITDNGIAVTVGSQIFVNGIGSFTGDITVNSITIGLGSGQITTNTVVGNSALTSNTTGSNNVSVGRLTLNSNVTGAQNVAVGAEALRYYSTVSNQVAIGYQALRGNSTTTLNTGTQNVAVGYQAGIANSSGTSNTFVGFRVGLSNTSGNSNSSFGFESLLLNTVGNSNSAFGNNALYSNTSGINNSALGLRALYSNTTGSENTGVGFYALNQNTIGLYNVAVGNYALEKYVTPSNNTALGYGALTGNASVEVNTGSNNVAVGTLAGSANTSGSNNTFVGRSSGVANTSGSNNTFLGYLAGDGMITGSNNTFVGDSTDGALSGSYQIAVGRAVVPTASNLGAWGGNTNATRTDLGVGTFTPLGRIHIETLAAANMGLYIAGSASQTGDLVEINATTFGQNYFTVTGVGSVGISTNTPSQALDINGAARFRNRIFDNNNTAGSIGQILSSTGTGVAWSTISATGIITGIGSVNVIPKFSSSTSLTTSNISDNGTQIVFNNNTNTVGLATFRNISLTTSSLTTSAFMQFVGAYGDPITLNVGLATTGSISFNGSQGQLFTITNNLTTGSIFSVNDVSGIPSIDVNANGNILIAPYGGNIGIGTTNAPDPFRVQTTSRFIGLATFGAVNITRNLYDANSSTGLAGQLLSSVGAGVAWSSAASLGVVTGTGAASQITVWNSNNTITGFSTFVFVNPGVGINTTVPIKSLHIRNNGILIDGSSATDPAGYGPRLIIDSGASSAFVLADFKNNLGSVFYVTGSRVSIGNSSVVTNVFNVNGGDALINTLTVGLGSGQVATNTAVGFQALSGVTTGVQVTAFGYQAGLSNTIGIENTFIGYLAGRTNTSGSSNIALGGIALFSNSTGGFNVAVGRGALTANTIGNNNAALGHGALSNNTSGSNNSAFGFLALQNNVTTSGNTGIGRDALRYYSNSSNQTAVGFGALQGNGTVALNTGTGNVAVGYQAGLANTSGSNNTALGSQAGVANTTGNQNTFIGAQSGDTNTTGNSNTYLGYLTDGLPAGSYQIAVGDSVTPTASNLGAWGGISNATRTNLGIGTFTPLGRLHVETLAATNIGVYIAGFPSQTGNLFEIDATTNGPAYFVTTGIGSVGIYTSVPTQPLHVQGNVRITGGILDSNNQIGLAGSVLSSTGSGISWITSAGASGVTGSGSTNRVAKFSGPSSVTDSTITDTGSVVTIGVGLSVSGFSSSFGFYGPGTNITNLNASNLASGTVPSAVVNGNYSGITSVGTLSQLNVAGISTLQNLELDGWLRDVNNSIGSSGQILSSTGSGVAWSNYTSLGIVTGSGSANQVTFWATNDRITGISTFIYNGALGIGTINPRGSLETNNEIYVDNIYFGIGNSFTNTLIGFAVSDGSFLDESVLIGYNVNDGSNSSKGVIIGSNASTGNDFSGIDNASSHVIIGTRASSNNTIRPGGGGKVIIGSNTYSYINNTNDQDSGNLVVIGTDAYSGTAAILREDVTRSTIIGPSASQYASHGDSVIIGACGFNTDPANLYSSYSNTIIGNDAGVNFNSASYNTIIGRAANSQTANSVFSGVSNVLLGDSTQVSNNNYQIAIGANATVSKTNSGAWGGITNYDRVDLGIGTFAAAARLHVQTLSSVNNGILVAGGVGQTASLLEVDATLNGVTYFIVTGIGSVGIYTSVPAVPFHSYGAARIDNSLTLNATTADTKTRRIFAGASTSTSSTSFVTIASITVPTGFTLNLEAKVNGWVSTALNESGKAFGIFYNNAGAAVQVGTTDVVSKYLGVGGNFDIQTSGANVNIVVKSNSGASTWFWKTQYDYLLSQNS